MNRALLATLLSLILIDIAYAQTNIPNINIKMSYREFENGQLSPAVHILELWCYNEKCNLTIISTTQCIGPAFFILSFTYSNMDIQPKDSHLEVKYFKNGALQLGGATGNGNFSYFFTFREARTDSERFESISRIYSKNLQDRTLITITDFKGNITRYDPNLKKFVFVEFIPLVEKPSIIKLDCDLAVLGTPSLNKKK